MSKNNLILFIGRIPDNKDNTEAINDNVYCIKSNSEAIFIINSKCSEDRSSLEDFLCYAKDNLGLKEKIDNLIDVHLYIYLHTTDFPKIEFEKPKYYEVNDAKLLDSCKKAINNDKNIITGIKIRRFRQDIIDIVYKNMLDCCKKPLSEKKSLAETIEEEIKSVTNDEHLFEKVKWVYETDKFPKKYKDIFMIFRPNDVSPFLKDLENYFDNYLLKTNFCIKCYLLDYKDLCSIDELLKKDEDKPKLFFYVRNLLIKSEDNAVFIQQIDKRYKFLDSSIWHRYVYLDENHETFQANVNSVLADFQRYYEWGLYDTIVAKEFCDFNIRIAKESYLYSVEEGGHATNITPFVFHSETEMKKKADGLRNELKNKGLQWKILLIDDFANQELRIGKGGKTSETKQKIIQELIGGDIIASVKSCLSIEKAQEELKKNFYDVILLDYLFSHNDKGEEIEAEYGTKLLKHIELKESPILKKGLFNRHWIFPISVFADAFMSKLEDEGISHISEEWVLARGADPINTPQLFRHNFYQFLKLQIDLVCVSAKEIFDFFFKNSPMQEEKEEKKIKEWARRIFGHFIQYSGDLEYIQSIKQTLKEENGFVSSMLSYLRNNEHENIELINEFRQLLYLLAYGQRADWHIMFHTYIRIKNKWEKFINTHNTQEEKEKWKVIKSTLEEIDKTIKELANIK